LKIEVALHIRTGGNFNQIIILLDKAFQCIIDIASRMKFNTGFKAIFTSKKLPGKLIETLTRYSMQLENKKISVKGPHETGIDPMQTLAGK
jgi:hypothetical protein